MAKAEAKILRLGILQGGKIIEERLLRRRETVTIGQSPKNTFYVPISKLPRSLTLFEVKGDQYLLSVGGQVQGRVSLEEQVRDLPELAKHPKAVKKGGQTLFPLDDKCRGKIVLGDITVLFQFVQPPPVVPKPQLPASARGGIGYALMRESAFLLAILASLVIQGGFIALSIAFETPPDQVKKKNRFLQALKVDVEIEEKEEEIEEPTDTKPKPDEEKEEAEQEIDAPPEIVEPEPPPMPEPPKKPKRVEKTAPKPEKRVAKSAKPSDVKALKERRRTKVRNNTILKHITAAGPGGSAGPDALRNGQRYADAFKADGPVVVGEAGDIKGFQGGPKLDKEAEGGSARVAKLDKKERGDDTLKTGKVKVAKKRVERKVKLRVGLKGGQKTGGLGKLDGSQVTSVFRRRSSAFRTCYESRLKVNPNISGKIVIRFTIGTAGRITNISVASNSTGDSAVGSCIVGKVRRWRFSPPENGAVTFTYPIVLSKG